MSKDQKLNRNRALVEQATTKLLKAVSTALQDDDCCLTVDKFIASDGGYLNFFGSSCSISNDLVIIGAYGADSGTGAAYLFNLNGNELKKLTPGSEMKVVITIFLVPQSPWMKRLQLVRDIVIMFVYSHVRVHMREQSSVMTVHPLEVM